MFLYIMYNSTHTHNIKLFWKAIIKIECFLQSFTLSNKNAVNFEPDN